MVVINYNPAKANSILVAMLMYLKEPLLAEADFVAKQDDGFDNVLDFYKQERMKAKKDRKYDTYKKGGVFRQRSVPRVIKFVGDKNMKSHHPIVAYLEANLWNLNNLTIRRHLVTLLFDKDDDFFLGCMAAGNGIQNHPAFKVADDKAKFEQRKSDLESYKKDQEDLEKQIQEESRLRAIKEEE